MSETDHAVTATVIHHGAFERDDPGSLGRQRQVRHNGVLRVEIDKAFLHGPNLFGFIHLQDFRKLILQCLELHNRPIHCRDQFRFGLRQLANQVIVQTVGADFTAVVAKQAEFFDDHSRLPGVIAGGGEIAALAGAKNITAHISAGTPSIS